MAFITVEDTYGTFDAMLFARQYERYKDLLEEDKMVTIRGKISIRDGKSPCVLAESMIAWEKKGEESQTVVGKTIYLRFDTKNIDVYNKVKKIASTYLGDSQVVIKCTSSGKAFAFSAKVDANNYLINEFIGLLGEENVVVRQ